MKVTHTFELAAFCPLNGTEDKYVVEVTLTRFFETGKLVELCKSLTKEPVYQEALAQQIKTILNAEKVSLTGAHDQVYTVVEVY